MTACAPSDLIAPAHYLCPEYHWTEGQLVAELLAGCSDDKGPYILDAEQRLVIDSWFGYVRTPSGPRLAAFEGAVIAPRQNLKTGVLKAAALGKVFISEQHLVVWSSHEAFASSEAYRDIKLLIESNSDMLAEVVAFHGALGRESIEFTGDRRLLFKARTGTSARSLSGDTVILDEAFALQPEHMASLTPTLAARPDPQLMYGSSAGLLSSAVLRAVRDRGRTGSLRLAYAEWCATWRACADPDCEHAVGTPGCWLDDEDAWEECNTAVRRGRITLQTLRGLRSAMAAEPLKFARECMGAWDDPGDDGALRLIDRDLFSDLVGTVPGDDPVFALDVAPRRSWSCIVSGSRTTSGRVHLEIPSRAGALAHWRGTDEIMPTFRRLAKRFPGATVVLLSKSQAVVFAERLDCLGFDVQPLSMGDYPAACAALVGAIDAQDVGHNGSLELLSSVEAAVAVEVGEEQYRWGRRKSGGDITPLVGMTLAYAHLADTEDYDPLDSVG